MVNSALPSGIRGALRPVIRLGFLDLTEAQYCRQRDARRCVLRDRSTLNTSGAGRTKAGFSRLGGSRDVRRSAEKPGALTACGLGAFDGALTGWWPDL